MSRAFKKGREMNPLLALFLFLIFQGCKEFYDEEFEEFEQSRINQSNQNANNIYTANLIATDNSLINLSGDAKIIVRDGEVKIDVSLEEIPENVIQLHYSFVNSDCSGYSVSIPVQGLTTRSYNILETLSIDALEQDLKSSGASQSEGDVDLDGKSLVIKAFSNLPGIPTPNGTNQLTIACGELVADEVNPERVNAEVFGLFP